jgi:3-hydroxyisobutyrate dehydrogenase-like beta-hydroxyacid dehydrogenase
MVLSAQRIGLVGTFDGYADLLAVLAGISDIRLRALPLTPALQSGEIAIRGTVRELVADSDVVLCLSRDDADFAQIMLGERGLVSGIGEGQPVLDLSPVLPWTFMEASAQFTACGAILAGASLHRRATATTGFAASVDDAGLADDRLREILNRIASPVRGVGGAGNSKAVAIIDSHLSAVSAAASAEALALGEAAGISADMLVTLLLKGSGANATLRDGADGGGSSAQSGSRSYSSLRRGLRQSNALGRRVRHPSWLGAVAADAFCRVSAAGDEDALQALLRDMRPGKNLLKVAS